MSAKTQIQLFNNPREGDVTGQVNRFLNKIEGRVKKVTPMFNANLGIVIYAVEYES